MDGLSGPGSLSGNHLADGVPSGGGVVQGQDSVEVSCLVRLTGELAPVDPMYTLEVRRAFRRTSPCW